jgi:hypothetical protein
VLSIAEYNPTHVRPEAAIVRRMGIAGLVGILVVHAVGGNPKNRSAFERQRSANRKEVFDELRYPVRTMRMQPVIAHADAKADRHPIENGCNNERFPAKHEQGGNRARMEQYQSDTGYPINFLLARSRFHMISLD